MMGAAGAAAGGDQRGAVAGVRVRVGAGAGAAAGDVTVDVMVFGSKRSGVF